LSAFCAARALPSGVFGPRDLAPFLRLASARALEAGAGARTCAPETEAAARAAAPSLDMTGFLVER
jgi:hypothetical protein